MMNANPATIAARLLDQCDLGLGSPSGSQQVVVDQHPLAGLDRVDVHLEDVGAVLQFVLAAATLQGSFPGLRAAAKPTPRAISQRGPQDETTGLGAENDIDILLPGIVGQAVYARWSASAS